MLANIFEIFPNMCLKLYKLDPTNFISALGLAWQAALKKTKVKLKFLSDSDMLLMVEKCIRSRIGHTIYQYVKANNKCMKGYDENKESSYLQYCNINYLYGWTMLQKVPAGGFQWFEESSKLIENFIKS